MDVINKIAAVSPPTSKKETQAFYTPDEKELLAAYEGVRAALEVVGTVLLGTLTASARLDVQRESPLHIMQLFEEVKAIQPALDIPD